MKVKYTLLACSDCLRYVANGDVPEDRPGLGDVILERLGIQDSTYLVCGDDSKDEEFSWSSCECCGSGLGGSRCELVVLWPEPGA